MIRLLSRCVHVVRCAILAVALVSTPLWAQDAPQAVQKAFPKALVMKMQAEAAKFQKPYPAPINPFSTCQYGGMLLEGTIDIGDVFDARIPANMDAFRKYARDQGLDADTTPENRVNRFAKAAAKFLCEYDYDVVLYRPDEFHPAFTHLTDTWMFVRETAQPSGDARAFRSVRLKKRVVTLSHAAHMRPMTVEGVTWFVPEANAVEQFHVESMASKDTPTTYSPSHAADATKRLHDGHIASPLSGHHGVRVGRWTGDRSELDIGPSFSGKQDEFTWSATGVYYLPLDVDFWKDPPSANSPSHPSAFSIHK